MTDVWSLLGSPVRASKTFGIAFTLVSDQLRTSIAIAVAVAAHHALEKAYSWCRCSLDDRRR